MNALYLSLTATNEPSSSLRLSKKYMFLLLANYAID